MFRAKHFPNNACLPLPPFFLLLLLFAGPILIVSIATVEPQEPLRREAHCRGVGTTKHARIHNKCIQRRVAAGVQYNGFSAPCGVSPPLWSALLRSPQGCFPRKPPDSTRPSTFDSLCNCSRSFPCDVSASSQYPCAIYGPERIERATDPAWPA